MADGYNIDELRAAGLSEADIAALMGFDIAKYQADYQASTKAAEDARARGLTAAQATGLSDKYVALNDPRANDLIGGGINEQIMGRLGLIPQSYDYAPVFNIKGDKAYENYNFVPIPGKEYRLVDNNTGQVVGTATNATEAKGLAEAANAISQQQGGNANWALQEYGSYSDGKGNMTSGYSDVYTNEKTGFANDISMLVQAAGVMAMAGAGLAAATAQTAAAAAGTGAAAGSTTSSLVSASSLASSTAANVATISNIAASQAAAAGLTQASSNLLAQVGMGALRGGITTAAFGGDPIKGAITGGFSALGSEVLGPLVDSVKGAGEVATNFGSSVGAAAGTTVGSLVTGQNLQDSFVNGLINGATQYVSTEIAEEIQDAKQRAASEARSKIQDAIADKLDLYEGVTDPATRNILTKFDLDQIVVDAAKQYGDDVGKWASEYVASTLSALAKGPSDTGQKADTGTTTTAGIADLSEAARESIASQIDAVQENLLVTGNSAAGLTAANKAINDLIVNAQAKYGDRGSNFIKSYVANAFGNLLNVTATDARKDTDTTAGIGNIDLTATATTVAPTAAPTTQAPNITLTATTAAPTVRPTTQAPNITLTATTAAPTVRPTTQAPNITLTATTTAPTVRPTTQAPNVTVTATTAAPTTMPPTTQAPNLTVTATTVPPTTAPTTQAPATYPPTRPPTWTTKDWVMLGLAVPNLINRITGKGDDVGTITPDSSRVTFNPLNRERGIGGFDPFTYGQAGPGYQTAEYEFFKPYTTAQPEQKYTPTNVTYTPGADIYEYTPAEFEKMKADANAQYAARTAAFNNFQQTLAKQVESGAMTLEQAQAEARAYAEPYGGAIIPQKAQGGIVHYANGGAVDPEYQYTPEWKKAYLDYMQGRTNELPPRLAGNTEEEWARRMSIVRGYGSDVADQTIKYWDDVRADPAYAEDIRRERETGQGRAGIGNAPFVPAGYAAINGAVNPIGSRGYGESIMAVADSPSPIIIYNVGGGEQRAASIDALNKAATDANFNPFTYGQSENSAETAYFNRLGMAEGGEADDDMVRHLLEYRKGGGHNGPGPVKGIGSGQEDKIPAWLSDGEYVWSAQDVADLGDGSTDEGVRRLDKMRQMVRKQAGRKDVKKIAKPQRGIEEMLKAVGGKV